MATFDVPEKILALCRAIREAGGRALLVGGGVRDRLLGLPWKDFDLEVYGLSAEALKQQLERFGEVNTVGESFTVYKLRLNGWDVDVSLPRREVKSGRGHRGFLVTGDPFLSLEEATRRRDFTINAMLYDPLAEELLDPFGGRMDLEQRILRMVDARTFPEDSLRVLRAMQLAARFECTIEPQTQALCRSIDLSDLPSERIWGEVEKLLLLARRPSIGLQVALDLLIIEKLFPDLKWLVGCPQDPIWHPEGDVWTHTLLAVDQAATLVREHQLPKAKWLTVMLAVLLHDIGKPLTTREEKGRIRSIGHEEAGLEPSRRVLDRLNVHTINGYDVRGNVLALVADHLKPAQFYRDRERVSDGAFRRLAARCDLELLYLVAKADALARGPASNAEAEEWFIARARALGVEHAPPRPLLMGRHLLQLGMKSGPEMGRLLRTIYEMQLDGKVTTLEEALAVARQLLAQESIAEPSEPRSRA
ncbi:MAG: HD domain-containing protein [Blastocatellia bacterium]|nr:HD domain-containing protein [Blastocatellia bacterium]MDW8168798.1 HD domain-containing protein [Acidobacteriota bacterium]